jgi:twitching motility protein PilT
MDLDLMLSRAVEHGASDIHLKLGRPPLFRRDGTLHPLEDWPTLDDEALEATLATITALSPQRLAAFHETGELDIAYANPTLPRFRVNGFRQRDAVSFAFRLIPKEVPGFDQLRLPAGVRVLAEEPRGLVLATGATGVGKTTTLAAMIDHINRTRRQHILTIEDPIEILHEDKLSIVNQREVGFDTPTFHEALRRLPRQDPDIILIGELRDPESAEVALQAADSGHFVFSTMHTMGAAETIDRFLDFFDGPRQVQARSVLATVLRGVISQRLLPRIGGGRVAAVEVMVKNARIAQMIRDKRTDEITPAIAEGQYLQMQTFDQALIELVLGGEVEQDLAADTATHRHDFLIALDYALKARAAEEGAQVQAANGGQAEPPIKLPPLRSIST